MSGLEAELRAVAETLVEDTLDIDDLVEAALARAAWRGRRGYKVCSRCRLRKPVTEFSLDSTRRDGLEIRCRACRSRAV